MISEDVEDSQEGYIFHSTFMSYVDKQLLRSSSCLSYQVWTKRDIFYCNVNEFTKTITLLIVFFSFLYIVVSVCPSNAYLQNIRRIPPHQFKEVSLGELKHHVFIYRLRNKWQLLYQAFCSGSIITEDRVLTSAHCFLSNQKRLLRSYKQIRIVGGILNSVAQQQITDDIQQWRSIEHLYSQRFYRFPAFNLAIAKVDTPWSFNQYVGKIPYTKWNQDFDGVCMGIGLSATTSFSRSKQLYSISLTLIKRRNCERTLLRSGYLYYCTRYEGLKFTSSEAEGAGLICHGTGDPSEDDKLGVLVGVTSLINIGIPSLHARVGVYHQWVTDSQIQANISLSTLIVAIFLIKLIYL